MEMKTGISRRMIVAGRRCHQAVTVSRRSRPTRLWALTALIGMLLAACSSAQPATEAGAEPDETVGGSSETAAVTEGELDTDNPIVVAAPIAQSGAVAIYGEWQKPAIDMAVEDINAAGGVLGRPLEVVYEDVGADTAGGAAAVQRALAADPVAIYGMLFSFSVRGAMEVIDEAGIPLLNAAQEYALSATEDGSEWFWRIRAHDQQLAAVMVDWVQQQGFETIAYQHATDPMNTSTVSQMVAQLEEAGTETLAVEKHNLGDTDFTAQTQNVVQVGPELNVVQSYSQEAATIARQQAELGLDAPTLWGPAMYFAVYDFQMVDPELVEGDYIALESAPAFSDDQVVHDWAERFEARSDLAPNEIAQSSYWGMFLLADAIERAGTTKPEALAEALNATKDLSEFNGITIPGGPITCDDNQNCLHNRVLGQFGSDGLEIVERYVGFQTGGQED